MASRHNAACVACGRSATRCRPIECSRGRASVRFGLRGFASVRKNMPLPGGCFSASAQRLHSRAFRVSEIFTSQAHWVCACATKLIRSSATRLRSNATLLKSAAAGPTGLRTPHYTGDLPFGPSGINKNWLLVPLLFGYLLSLGGAGFVGPDEPRYASVGREMARSGDWITPRLDGQPWFEKPPLLYWMNAAGQKLGFSDEWAARLPVALASLLFLLYFFGWVEREFSRRTAFAATAILATSAGWAAFSFGAGPPLPMTAALCAALLITLFDTRPRQGYLAGALLGLAILAKAFVPVVLLAPALLIARRKRLRTVAACWIVAAPWHLLCLARNRHAI